MSSSIKEEYSTPVKPAYQSATIRSAILGFGAMALDYVITMIPAISMFIWTILPEWLRNILTLETIQVGITSLLHLIAGYAGINIVKERVKKGDIQGVLRSK